MKYLFFVLWLTVSSLPTIAFASGDCPWILSSLRPLTRFSKVFSVDGVDGAKFVLRGQSEESAQRSLFNTAFINSIPNHHAAPLRRLSPAEAAQLLAHPERDLSENKNFSWTVEPFLEGKLGRSVTDLVWGNTAFAKVLFELPGQRQIYHDDVEALIEGLEKWPTQKLNQLSLLLESSTVEEIAAKVRAHLRDDPGEKAGDLIAQILKIAFGEEDFHMLCDLWVVTTVLGVFDFHAENWIQTADGVVVFDLNQFVNSPSKADPMEFDRHHHPFAGTSVTSVARQMFIRNITPDLRSFLAGQSLKTLKKLRIVTTDHRTIQTAIHEEDLRQILVRIAYVLKN